MKRSVKDMNERQLESYCQRIIMKWKKDNTPTIYLPSKSWY